MMQAAINPLLSYRQPATLYPMGQSDQAEINRMKLGNVLRRNNRPVMPRPNFSTVWASPYRATA
jgi:hypothetical protein